MDENKKLVIQVATFDGIFTMFTMTFFMVYVFSMKTSPTMAICFGIGLLIMGFGLWLLSKQKYDFGRAVLHLTALSQIYISADMTGENSGYEFFYFTSVTVPFVTFTVDEQKKGFLLTAIAIIVIVVQQIVGTGIFFEHLPVNKMDKILSVVSVMIFMTAIMWVARWQMDLIQKSIRQQQGELIHASNLKALGEMAGGIAHEINNPLQTLSLQSKTLKTSFGGLESVPSDVAEQLEKVDNTIYRIAKLIKGLRDLTRDVSNDPMGYFLVKELLEDVMNVSSERLKNLGIKLNVEGDTELAVNGHVVQISQVLINLLNNSIDAVGPLDKKWITIQIKEISKGVRVEVTDSGPGIPKAIAEKLMLPFFTTKGPGKGTGLGLSISKSIIERNGGRFFLDTKAAHTKFVIELPGVTEIA